MSQFLSYCLDSPGVLEVMEEERLCGDNCSCLRLLALSLVLVLVLSPIYWNRFLRPQYHSCSVAWAA